MNLLNIQLQPMPYMHAQLHNFKLRIYCTFTVASGCACLRTTSAQRKADNGNDWAIQAM